MDYMDISASLYTFADIYVNGEHYGFFLALEDVDESFLDANYGE
jgi:spore coat protein CotH